MVNPGDRSIRGRLSLELLPVVFFTLLLQKKSVGNRERFVCLHSLLFGTFFCDVFLFDNNVLTRSINFDVSFFDHSRRERQPGDSR